MNDKLFTEDDVIQIVKFTIRDWATISELEKPDHQAMKENWIKNELKNFMVLKAMKCFM
jgi:hypothetical protein